jgi:hypothetical protein
MECHYDCLLFLNPDVISYLELTPYFSGPQDPPPVVRPWPCILPQGPLKLPTLVPIRRSSEKDQNGLLCLANPCPWWVHCPPLSAHVYNLPPQWLGGEVAPPCFHCQPYW